MVADPIFLLEPHPRQKQMLLCSSTLVIHAFNGRPQFFGSCLQQSGQTSQIHHLIWPHFSYRRLHRALHLPEYAVVAAQSGASNWLRFPQILKKI